MKNLLGFIRPDKQPAIILLLIGVVLTAQMIKYQFLMLFVSIDSDDPNANNELAWAQAELAMAQAEIYLRALLAVSLCFAVLVIWQKFISFVPGKPKETLIMLVFVFSWPALNILPDLLAQMHGLLSSVIHN